MRRVIALLLACWAMLIARRDASERVTVGVLTDGRIVDELHGAIGPFDRHVAATMTWPRNMIVREAIARAEQASIRAAQRAERDWDTCATVDGEELRGFAYAFEWLEIAGYEQLERVATRAGDTETVQLAQRIIGEERAAAEKLRGLLPEAARLSLLVNG